MNADFFFQSTEFVYRDLSTSIIKFEEKDCIIFFSRNGKQLISLPRSPFGSFIFSDVSKSKNLHSLISKFVMYAEKNEMESIEIKCFPEIYSLEKSMLINEVLLANDFVVKCKDTAQFIPVEEKLKLNRLRERKLDECISEKFTFKKLDATWLQRAHHLFEQSRENKGYPVTMKLSDFEKEFSRFPEHYFLYGVFDEEQLIASSVVIAANEEILYYFFQGDSLLYRKYSPNTMLIQQLYQVARENNFRFIDLGLSTDEGKLNKGLYDFKKSFGALDSPKLTFTLNL